MQVDARAKEVIDDLMMDSSRNIKDGCVSFKKDRKNWIRNGISPYFAKFAVSFISLNQTARAATLVVLSLLCCLL